MRTRRLVGSLCARLTCTVIIIDVSVTQELAERRA